MRIYSNGSGAGKKNSSLLKNSKTLQKIILIISRVQLHSLVTSVINSHGGAKRKKKLQSIDFCNDTSHNI